jgi:hypothetical protein
MALKELFDAVTSFVIVEIVGSVTRADYRRKLVYLVTDAKY